MQALLGEPLVVAERTPWVQLSNKSSARLGVEKLTEIFQDIVVGGELKAIQERYGVNFD
jgi:polar amino acid transport system substrate-binding protein